MQGRKAKRSSIKDEIASDDEPNRSSASVLTLSDPVSVSSKHSSSLCSHMKAADVLNCASSIASIYSAEIWTDGLSTSI